MKFLTTAILLVCLCAVQIKADMIKSNKIIARIGQSEVCKIKKSCVDCLRLTHCSWCKTGNKCFSKEMEPETCENDRNEYIDFGFSLQENAECGCQVEDIKQNCFPEGTDQDSAVPCNGRGRCVCGRCVCDTFENSTKMVMGEYCEFDNFSCDGPRCNEGPYSLNNPVNQDE